MGDRYPSDWDTRRKNVYSRDNHRCQRCGARGGRRGDAELHAHHQTPISEGGSHRYSNLTTVCKSCHEDIHGHGVGGRSSSSTSSQSTGGEEVDPVAMAISVALVLGVVFLAVTYGAAIQALPAGQTVSEEYTIEYGTVTDDPDGYGREYDYDVGPPLLLRYELADDVISETGETRLRVILHNPSDNHLRGRLKLIGRTNYRLKGELATFNFDLSADETVAANVTLDGETMVADGGFNPRTTKFNAEAQIFNDPYMAISTDQRDILADKMTLRVRKPLLERLGFYWLSFLGLCVVGAGVLVWKRRDGSLDFR
ncbi:HNH endonuclease [Halolamina salifodinae]|uniref:HNH nuclease domain-containing protein n=1 Tax=Halolamina salifodinae TaxID=1202767 RepID=A0A8T4GWF2_9EURY|nr:HNH endonuclease [Halolamina salifodinae]MBP1986780.1 hypothetical protein [Halolamina salifodinae]